jgi:hypothetical protein
VKVPFVRAETIRQYALETLREYERRVGALEFPLDVADIFDRLFGLATIYDDSGKLDRLYGDGVIGCLFPDGHVSPWGRDKLIVVNALPAYKSFSHSHTIGHEAGGHYVLHFLKGIGWSGGAKPMYCHQVGQSSRRKDPLEWQADRFAGELVMPVHRVQWLLDGKKPGEVINLDLYANNFRTFFGTSRAQMEKRLVDIGYKLIGTRYDWASCLKGRG